MCYNFFLIPIFMLFRTSIKLVLFKSCSFFRIIIWYLDRNFKRPHSSSETKIIVRACFNFPVHLGQHA